MEKPMKSSGGFYVSRIHKLGGRVFEKLLRKSRLDAFNGAQGRILYVLWEYGKLSFSDVGKYTSLAKTTLTSMIDRMEESGLVERVPDKEDRRQIYISITEKAKKHRQKYDKVSDEMNALFYKGFSADEIRRLETMLEKIIANLEEA
jgi:DNA-binding MarR family transcriptional regulator